MRAFREYLVGKARDYEKMLSADKPYRERLMAVMTDKTATLHSFSGELVEELRKQDRDHLENVIQVRRDAIQAISVPFFEYRL